MSIEIDLSPIFARYSNNQLKTKVVGNTLGQCLNDLVRQFPKLKKVLLDKKGSLFHTCEIYINGESARPFEMKTPLRDGDKLNIIFIIQGG